ncbi:MULTISPECIES: type IV toxin-antitoxin system AbiEi family antitoxin domain-containing protein [unclassified Dietzia]|uniref:type IV toxin-antitoxin system AbiEi family antitoxin domain-containing protein n=1 Tax=unclassified Dietzia TaxID=2617939 RepID=UPI000D3128C0|nr:MULTISPECIES: type IV toxin-antitoxin system AbiEi family antitoxin domain-containing protein [unclassified Dietzia]QGW25630.1 hypothetical protein GJR88_04005 [Dietzia sp. DQ12-45-1b]
MTPVIPFPTGWPFTTAEATRAGLSHRALTAAVAQGRLIKIRHGWFHAPQSGESTRDALARSSRIALYEGPLGAVISHHTAAALHGLPLIRARTDRVHLTVDRPTGGRRTPHIQVYSSPRDSLDTTQVDGIPVTCVARTVVDLARSAGFDAGVCAADHALRLRMVTADGLASEVDRHRGRTGVAIARDVVDFADPRAESPGESLSRCVMRRCRDVPAPRLQHRYFSSGGRPVARTDFSWGDGALAGEFDGRTKYSRCAAGGEDPGEVVWREKQREDRLRALGVVVVRWVWDDLYAPNRFERLLLDGLRRSGVR